MKAELIDRDECVKAIYELSTVNEASVIGNIYTICGWEIDFKTPIDKIFFAEAYIKWDGCSHFNFFGEDYTEGDKETVNSYYHICGIYSYLEFMRTMLFGYEVMAHYVGDNILEKEEYKEIKELNLLKEYSIRYYENDEESFVYEDKF